jgi:hypothetical protein
MHFCFTLKCKDSCASIYIQHFSFLLILHMISVTSLFKKVWN